ncbi:unnamed protein product [Allacma fusca]|uniref:Uncharacterized protein n=1 Tax=Allacma fusca TaxID=39272 RepID=A0A8J2PNA2_9HEXA|nr:unnamed protein product [Allacma fusca]
MNNHDAPQAFQQNKSHQRLGTMGTSSSMAKRKQQLHEYSSASPPLTEDSGQWSCSFPSSPIKEQSPHGSGNHNVKSSSGSTSSCSEYNNNSRKSELYGTPHWWPVAQGAGETKDGRKIPKYNDLLGSNPTAAGAVVETKDTSLESTSSSSTTPGVKYCKPLAFTINFHDAPGEDIIHPEEDSTSCCNDNPEEILPPPVEIIPEKIDVVTEEPEPEPEPEPVVDQTTSDVKSDNGTYTLDDDDSSFVQEDRTSSIQLSQIDNNDWIQKWATEASAHVPDIQPIPPYDETFKILDETRSIVNAMQSRVTTTDSTKKNAKLKPEHPSSIKFNRAFNIRRNINTQQAPVAPPSYDSDNTMSRSSMSDKFQAKQSFVRADGGRFSLRVKKGLPGSLSDTEVRNFPYAAASLPKPQKSTPIPPIASSRPLTTSPVRSKSILGPNSNIRHQGSSVTNNNNAKSHTRSNSTITSRDIEMENWKRRKSYDPLKSAGMGISSKRVEEIKRKGIETGGSTSSTKPTPAVATKSPSVASMARQLRASPAQFEAAESTTPASSIHSHSPTPYDHCCGSDYVRVHDWLQLQQQLTRSSCETTSSPRKFEALDTLVISTIFSLSNKVRNLSLGLLKKIHPAQQDDENSALIEEMITQLSEMTTGHTDKQGQKSSSKELSGILKNVKKIEQVILVLDRVLCDQDDESSSDC